MQGPTTPSINSSFGSNDDDDSDDDESNDDSDDEEEEYKMVLVVRTDLQMTKGKIAAQCCHAAVAVVSELIRLKAKKVLDVWEESGSTKVNLILYVLQILWIGIE